MKGMWVTWRRDIEVPTTMHRSALPHALSASSQSISSRLSPKLICVSFVPQFLSRGHTSPDRSPRGPFLPVYLLGGLEPHLQHVPMLWSCTSSLRRAFCL